MTDAETNAVYRASRIGQSITRGQHPGLLVVDLQRGFTEPGGPLGGDLSEAVVATRTLLNAARDGAAPVIFTVIAYGEPAEAGVWLQKMPRLAELRVGGPWTELDARLGRRAGEPVIAKRGASALNGTNVAALLTARAVDTVVVAGATTSGCVRATVVDLMQAGFPTLVVGDCCGDRTRAPHEANLFDMASKYADVVDLADACTYVSRAADLEDPAVKELTS